MKGDITRLIPNYRRTLIVKIKNLTYLDDKPIKNEDKVGAEAYFKGGYQAEKEARIKYREENGKFNERKELLKVPKLGKVAFEQCSGFMRIPNGKNPLEITAVHPESYEVTEKLLQK